MVARTQEQVLYVPRRPLPFDQMLITATTSGAAQTFYTVRGGKMFEVERLVVSNQTATAATLTLHAIPSGGVLGAGNVVFGAKSIPANDSIDLSKLTGQLYKDGTILKAYSGTASALVLDGWGEELL